MRDVIAILKEEGEYHDQEDYFLYGNPVNPKEVVVFEKLAVFLRVLEGVDRLDYSARRSLLLICSYGVPSESLLKYLKQLNPQKVGYYGDLDPTSFFVYLTLIHLTRTPKPTDKKRLLVNYCGVRADDYTALPQKKVLIRLKEEDKKVLAFVEQFRLPQLAQETAFLKKKNAKLEMDAILAYGLEDCRKKIFQYCSFD